MRKPLTYITISFFLVLCILVRIPFYTHFFVPEFDPDSFDYFNYSFLINHSAFHEIGKLPIDLPPGYPVFVSFLSLFTNSAAGLIYGQLFIYLAACVALLFELSNWGRVSFLLGAIGLLFFSINSYTITYESALITESLYISSLIILTAAVFRGLRMPSKTNMAWQAIAIILPSFIRPTGLSQYFLAAVFAFYFYKKAGAAKLGYFIAPLLLLSVIWASWNYCTSGIFLPGNYKRIIAACHIKASPQYLDPVYEDLRAKDGVIMEDTSVDSSTLKSRTVQYMHQITEKVPNFYSSLMPTRIRRFYIYNLPSIPQLQYMYDGKMLIPPTVKKYTYREYLDMPQKSQANNMIEQLNFENCKRNPYILLYSVFNKLENVLIRNKIFNLLIVLSLILGVALSFTSFVQPKNFAAFFIPFLMLFCSIIVGALFGKFQYRYGHVILFIVYLMPCLYAILLRGFSGRPDFLKK